MADEEVVETDSTSSTEEATVEEPTSVPNKVSLKVGEKQYNFEPDAFQKVADAYEKAQKWETSYHKKGEQLNKLRDELYTKEKEVADNKAVLEEYRKIKKAFEANPSAYAAVQKALNEGQPTLNPQIQELEKKQQ
jgi:ABC-type Fe3+-citrate transport system substrate-binding protein